MSGGAEVRVAVFPVAGRGTRMLPATKALAKELLPLYDRPLLQWSVEEALASGVERLIFVIGENGSAIRKHFSRDLALEQALESAGKHELAMQVRACALPEDKVAWVVQDSPLGFGHAVGLAAEAVGDNSFAVLLPDDFVLAQIPCLAQLIEARRTVGGDGIFLAVEQHPLDEVSAYGVLVPESKSVSENDKVITARSVVEKPTPETAPSQDCIIGRYILTPRVFEALRAGQRGVGGEIQLTDALAVTVDSGVPLYGVRFDGKRFDCGQTNGWLTANRALADAHSSQE